MVNKVILVGNVGADPEVKYLDGGVAVANIRLATTENYRDKNGERISQTEWHNVVFWRGLAETVEKYVKKGMKLYIEGRLRTRSWDDQNGIKRYTTEIFADNMQMLSSKQEQITPMMAQSSSAASKSVMTPEISANDDVDDLPF